ncbi:hypothetical protein [Pseudomonas sp. CFBP 13719]|uniref:hypothetical protein n=1 Tax=Pseudomonas sp. CFBP 13719 TaxID=2775303 RepID=UPI00177EF3D3|nr:hypothetical protein [Pseudomonas sp. CFBP 13719]MBD8614893.1 hypothetical protein [Pseudomonas putida]MBD8681423.1 hypothetical protein [Pseudomonas sp. CFBP 13719]
MKMLKILAAASAIALLAGCAGTPPQTDAGQYAYDGIPDQMIDAWVGAATPTGETTGWTFAMDLRKKELSVATYYSRDCQSMLKYQRTEPNGGVLLLEQGRTGKACFANHYVRLTQQDINSLSYAYYTIDGKMTAEGTMRRSGTTAFKVNMSQALIGTWSGPVTLANGQSTTAQVSISNGQVSSVKYATGCQSRLFYRNFLRASVAFEEQASAGQQTCAGAVTTFSVAKDGRLLRSNLNAQGQKISETFLKRVR